MSEITKSRLRDLLDDLRFTVGKDDDGDYYTILEADDDFRHNVQIYFLATQGRLQMVASSPAFKVPSDKAADALLFCNKWQREKAFGRAYFNENTNLFLIDASISTDTDIPDDYVKEDFLRLHVAIFWSFFVEAGKEF